MARIREPLLRFFQKHYEITAPGTVDGGDICEAGRHFFIGVSHRTNEEGARQLAAFLALEGYTSSIVDIRAMTTILHLKSGISYIGENTLVLMEEMADRPEFKRLPDHPRVRSRRATPPTASASTTGSSSPSGFPGLEASLRAARLPAPGPGHVGVPEDGRRPELSVPALLSAASGLRPFESLTSPGPSGRLSATGSGGSDERGLALCAERQDPGAGARGAAEGPAGDRCLASRGSRLARGDASLEGGPGAPGAPASRTPAGRTCDAPARIPTRHRRPI